MAKIRARKKPVVIEAVQWTEDNLDEMKDFVGDHLIARAGMFGGVLHKSISIKTLEGEMRVSKDDYVIRGVAGEFYPCKKEIFESTYETVK